MSSDDKFEAKFKYLVDHIEKQSEDNSDLFNNIEKEMKTISSILSNKIETSCSELFEKVLLYSEKPKEIKSIDDLVSITGYESDFNNAKNDYNKCTLNYKAVLDDITYNIGTYNMLGLYSYNLCLDQCKSEVKQNKLSECETKKCINTCYGYKKMNAIATYDIVIDNIENIKTNLNKL